MNYDYKTSGLRFFAIFKKKTTNRREFGFVSITETLYSFLPTYSIYLESVGAIPTRMCKSGIYSTRRPRKRYCCPAPEDASLVS